MWRDLLFNVRRRSLLAGACSLVAVVPLLASLGASGAAGATAVTLSAGALGLNVAPWDGQYSSPSTAAALETDLEQAGITQLRYGGGDTADEYDWQTNTDLSPCSSTSLTLYTSDCAVREAFDFSSFAQYAREIGAQSLLTVNYGTGTPGEAAAWVRQAGGTAGEAAARWEIGNETYGCWEDNNELAAAPEDYQGYVANKGASCPMVATSASVGMQTMAESYAENAKLFMTAMKAANPSAEIGVPWAFDHTVTGAWVADNSVWNDTVLGLDARDIGFVDAHWYPFGFGGSTGGVNPSDQEVLDSLFKIPSEYANIQSTLSQYDPSAKVIVGETGISFRATTIPCTPAGALFSAGDALQWLAEGAQSVDWWTTNTGSNTDATCENPDEGMFVGSTTLVPDSFYAGYLLISSLVKAGAELSTLATSDPTDVLAYQSVLPDGKTAIAFINTNTADAEQVSFSSALSGDLSEQTYSAADQNASDTYLVPSTTTAASLANGITLPAESIIVLTED
jgi:hypothetical protein